MKNNYGTFIGGEKSAPRHVVGSPLPLATPPVKTVRYLDLVADLTETERLALALVALDAGRRVNYADRPVDIDFRLEIRTFATILGGTSE